MKTAKVTNVIGSKRDYIGFVAVYTDALPTTYQVRVKRGGTKSIEIFTLRKVSLWQGKTQVELTGREALAVFVMNKMEELEGDTR